LVSGGGTIGDDRTTWSIRAGRGVPAFDASWTTGPASGHPQIGALSIASKLPKGLSYGVMGNELRSDWQQGGLIAVTQAGDSVTIWERVTQSLSGPTMKISTHLSTLNIRSIPSS